ncbi:MAG: glycosyltransferase family 39 protein [Smithellaceae bacterium]
MNKKTILFLVPLILYIAILGVMPQMEPDEARYSLIPSEMNASGNYVTPHIKNTIYLEKPPLAYWVTAMSFKVFGENDFSARLFTGLCAWGCILLAFFMGRHFRDEKTGLYASAVLSISVLPFILGRINILDMPLTFFLCLSVWLGYLAVNSVNKRHLYYLFYFACALAFLTKGIVGVVFPFAILVLWLIWTGRWRDIFGLVSPVGIVIFLIIVSPWLILAQMENSDFLWFFFVREHFLRFTTQMHGKSEPFYYFIPIIIGGTLPWSIYLIRAWHKNNISGWLFRKDENKLLVVWFLFIFLFFTVSSSKLATYIAPVFIPIALFAGNIFRNDEELTEKPASGRIFVYRLFAVIQAVIVVIALLLPLILKHYSDAEKGLVVMISNLWPLWIILPAVAVVLLSFLPDLIRQKYHRGWFATIYTLSALLLASSIFPLNDFLYPYRSSYVAKEAIKQHVPQDKLLYQYRVNFYGIDFYNKIDTAIVEDFGELADGIIKLNPEERKKYYLSVADFFELINEGNEIYCITQHQQRLKELQSYFPKVEILWDNEAFFLLRVSK